MESALKIYAEKKINEDFEVSTALFATHFETRVFSKIDRIPTVLAEEIKEFVYDTLDKAYGSLDSTYDSEGTPNGYNGVAVESYGFKDARTVHDMVTVMVRDYVDTHTRTVLYS